jgi:hypothetical protein
MPLLLTLSPPCRKDRSWLPADHHQRLWECSRPFRLSPIRAEEAALLSRESRTHRERQRQRQHQHRNHRTENFRNLT